MKRILICLLAALGVGAAAQAQQPHSSEVATALREMALSIRPADIDLVAAEFTERPWGLLMETGLQGGAFYSLVVFADGATSLYFSTGGGILGAGQHAEVRTAGKAMLEAAARLKSHAQAVSSTPPPGPGRVQFYLLSAHGTLGYSAEEKALFHGRDRMSELFYAGHAVIEQVRMLEEAQSQKRRQ